MKRWVWWLLGGIVGLVVLVVGGTWLYINVIQDDPPVPLSLETLDSSATSAGTSADEATTTPTTAPDPTRAASSTASTSAGSPESSGSAGSEVDGTWRATSDSTVGYRVKEILFGQRSEAVGRTNAVTGSLTVDGTSVPSADFTVDMTAVTSDQSRRDAQFQGRIMETAQFPTSTFSLTEPIDLRSVPAEGQELKSSATGDLTLRGTTRSVTFDVTARQQAGQIAVTGSIPIAFADWDIPNPSIGPVSTEDNGVLEFLLVFEPAG